MDYKEENQKEFEICGILQAWDDGYTGKGIKAAEIEKADPTSPIFDGKLLAPFLTGDTIRYDGKHGHLVSVNDHMVMPDATLYSLPSGFNTMNPASSPLVELTIPYAIEHGIHIIGASLGGMDHPFLNQAIMDAQKEGIIFTTSAGNRGQKEGRSTLTGHAKSGVWIPCGAVGWHDRFRKIQLKKYSSVGPELELVSFSGLYIPNRKGKAFMPYDGTSYTLFKGMVGLTQQFFLEKIGRTLYQDELLVFIRNHVMDLGEFGRDDLYGYGLWVLPKFKRIDVKKYIIHKEKQGGVSMGAKNRILIHHSASADHGTLKDFDAIKRWHVEHNGWRDIGYHWVIERVNGKLVATHGRKESEKGAHCPGQNSKAIGVCVVGNFDVETPSQELYEFVADICLDIMQRNKIPVDEVKAHRDFYATACPGANFSMLKLRDLIREREKMAFKDIANHWAKDAILAQVKKGRFVGRKNGKFDPNAPVTRAELATVLERMDKEREGLI